MSAPESAGDALAHSLLAAASSGDTASVESLLAGGCDPCFQEDEGGCSPLMLAAAAGHAPIVRALLAAGAPWNAVDRRGRCAGNHALDAGQQAIVDLLVDEAVRAELLLGAAERRTLTALKNSEYLSRGVKYDGDRLIDEGDDAVMMEWETPLMEAHAERLCAAGAGGADVLNVGFGMGIIDSAIQGRRPRSHTIIEAHPAVYARMVRDGWTARPGVRVLFGRWQDVLPGLEEASFDAAYYDTYGEHDADMADFHEQLPRLLRAGGVYSFFNGMCPFNVFFQGVACAVVQLELKALGLETSFTPVAVHTGPEAQWADIRRRYFLSDTYYLPHCVLGEPAAAAADDDSAAGAAGRRLVSLNPQLMVRRPPLAARRGDDAAATPSAHSAAHPLQALLAESLAPALGEGGAADGADGADGAECADAARVASLQRLVREQLSPPLEKAGWRVAARLEALWAAADAGGEATPPEEGLDANSAAVLRHVASLRGSGCGFGGELELALLPNPLGGATAKADSAEAGLDGGGGGGGGGGRCRGEDGGETALGCVEELWGGGAPVAWYGRSLAYWAARPPTASTMLGGLDDVHAADVAASLAFIDALRSDAARPLPDGVALDCGAGIGRVSASVLLPRFEAVDLVEPVAAFAEQAAAALPPGGVRRMRAVGLQEWEPAAGDAYAAVWAQWVLLYLTDDDLVDFLRRAARGLQAGGAIVVKESVAKEGRGWYADALDASVTRSDAHFRRLFERAGLEVTGCAAQPGLPRGVYAVKMYALAPAASSSRGQTGA